MSRGLLLCRYLMMIRTSQHWIPKQSHLWWVSIAAPLSRLTKKQPHPVKNPLSLSVPSCVHSVKSTKKARRPCFLPRWLQKDHLCYESNYNCSEGNWYVYCCPCFCWCSQFTDDEMARCKTLGTKGFHRLDNGKLEFLAFVLHRKFDSPFFSEQWNQMAARINTKCRGKRRTLIHRLKKTSLFWKHKDGTVSLSFPTKNHGSVN